MWCIVYFYQDILKLDITSLTHHWSTGTDSRDKLAIKMAERQASAMEEDEITSEDVSKWTKDLNEIILVQRARVRSLTAEPLMAETEMRKLESLESLLKDAIIAQDAHYKKLGSTSADWTEINEAYFKLESVKTRLREAIIDQGARVRKLRTDRATSLRLRRLLGGRSH